MEKLHYQASERTPEVVLDSSTGLMKLEGKCIPEDAHSFFVPIINWVSGLFESDESNRNTDYKFEISCEYYNSASAKMLVYLFDKIAEIQKTGYTLNVIWYCSQDDPDLMDSINDYTDITWVNIRIESPR